jgi:hypothetical protein
MSEPIRCLAVRQPWAWGLVSGVKDIENRSWSTEYRGPIAILASANKTLVSLLTKSSGLPALGSPFGAIVGVVDLIDVVPLSQELEANPWAWGPQCWRVANARAFPEPIPYKGKLNLFALDEGVAARVRSAMTTALQVERDAHVEIWINAMLSMDSKEERLQGLMEAYLSLSDGAGALRLVNALLGGGETADLLVDRARANAVMGGNDAALVDVAAAIAIDEGNARAYFVRSIIYDELSRAAAEKAASLDPTYAEGDPKGQAEDDDE